MGKGSWGQPAPLTVPIPGLGVVRLGASEIGEKEASPAEAQSGGGEESLGIFGITEQSFLTSQTNHCTHPTPLRTPTRWMEFL